jgi:hypothetical protein
MGDFWDDHAAMRPGTLGGDTARQRFATSIRVDPLPPPPPKPAHLSKHQEIPKVARPPKVAKPLKAVDFMAAAVVWLVGSLILWRGAGMDGGGAAAVAIVPCVIALKWWRPLIAVGFAGIVLWFFVHQAK